MWYSFWVAWLNSRGVGVVLKFDVLPHWDAVFCAAVCMLAMKHSVANVPSDKQLNLFIYLFYYFATHNELQAE